MSCVIENIKDDNLKSLVEKFGAKEGLKKFLSRETSESFDISSDDTESNEKNASYKTEAERLYAMRDVLLRKAKSVSDQETKDYYRDKAKIVKNFEDLLRKPENQEIGFLFRLLQAELDQAEELVNKGDTHTASVFINFYQDLIPSNLVGQELNDQKELILDRVRKLKAKIISEDARRLSIIANDPKLLDINGNPVPFVQESDMGAMLYDISVSKSPWVRELYKRVSAVHNKIITKLGFVRKNITELSEAVKKASSEKGDKVWDYMLQVNNRGERTGNSVSKYNWEYDVDRKSNYFDREKGTNKELNKYLDFLRDNHSFTIDQEAFDAYRNYKIDKIMAADVVINDGKVRTPEEEENYITNIKLDKIAKMSWYIDPSQFIKILQKKNRSSKDLDFVRNYLKPHIWKSFNGKRIVNQEVTNEKYFDKKYQDILGMDDNDPRKIFYLAYTDSIKKARMESNDWEHDTHVSLNTIPEMKAEANLWKKFPDWVKEVFTELPELPSGILKDPVTGEPLMTIHDSDMLSGKLPAKYKNYNLDKVWLKFIQGHISKKEKLVIEDDSKAILNIIRNQPEYEVDKKGNILMVNNQPMIKKSDKNNAFEAAKYHLEAFLYDKKQDKQGEGSTKYYDSVTQQRINELKSLINLSEKDQKELDELENSYTVQTTKKTINALIQWTTIKSLALNPFAGISEMLQSMYSMYVESAGSKFFTSSDITEAYGQAIKLLNPVNKEEAEKWFSNFPLINNFGLDIKDNIISKTFIGFNTSEKLSKGALLFAYLKNKNVTDKDGITYKLKDVIKFNDKGEVYLDDRFESFDINSPFRNEVYNELSALSKKILSRDNAKDYIPLNKGFVGRLLGQFRSSWMFEGYLRRWGAEHEDAILGKSKGFYRTLVFDQDDRVNLTRTWDILFLAMTNKQLLQEKYQFSELDANNIKKSLRELQIWTSLLAMYLSIALLQGDDDDEESLLDPTLNFLMNLSYRGNRDLSFYLNPKSTLEILDSPAASASTVKQLIQFGTVVVSSPFDPYSYEGTSREKLKVVGAAENLTPFYKGIKSSLEKFEDD